jgi:uncharacterized damage-inducible protein DinB
MPTIYRRGGLGALQDEYERATRDLLKLLETISDEEYLDSRPKEVDFLQSIQLIMYHVVRAAYGYADKIRKTMAVDVTSAKPDQPFTRQEAIAKLQAAIEYSATGFEDKWTMSDDDLDQIKMMAPWKVEYSIEQMMEHAIVHILRHRRQIERILSEP